eukprot:TRINITY_DN9384_c0_g1_i2.p1 TRINITY_DN9384_c0_g1~~TRINITY_DN9384_c0_g1_i2.p1  ORF type:complete len:217 (+),score=58.22 TRINITY_DN9384_c0_g1_i2:61-711(+)
MSIFLWLVSLACWCRLLDSLVCDTPIVEATTEEAHSEVACNLTTGDGVLASSGTVSPVATDGSFIFTPHTVEELVTLQATSSGEPIPGETADVFVVDPERALPAYDTVVTCPGYECYVPAAAVDLSFGQEVACQAMSVTGREPVPLDFFWHVTDGTLGGVAHAGATINFTWTAPAYRPETAPRVALVLRAAAVGATPLLSIGSRAPWQAFLEPGHP